MTEQPIIRNRYFDSPSFECNLSSSLVDEDFREFHLRTARTERASLHDFGVTQGLAVSGTLGSSILTINPGVAIDRQGRLIVLAQTGNGEVLLNPVSDQRQETPVPVTFDVTNYKGADQSTFYLTIQFSEVVRPPSPGDTEHDCGRFEQVPLMRLHEAAVTDPSIEEGTAVMLAIITLNLDGQVVTLQHQDGALPHRRRLVGKALEQLHIQRSEQTVSGNDINLTEIAAGTLGPLASGGVQLTVPNTSDMIRLTQEDGGQFANLEIQASTVVAKNAGGEAAFTLDTNSAALTIGNSGNGGDLLLNNSSGEQTIHLDGGTGNVALGGSGQDGDLSLNNSSGEQTIHLDGGTGNVVLGGSGQDAAGTLGPLVDGGLQLTVPNTTDQVVLAQQGGGTFAKFDVRAAVEIGGNLKLSDGIAISQFSDDSGLGNGNEVVPTQQAVKTYVDDQISQVNSALSNKANVSGSLSQDFNTANLQVNGDIYLEQQNFVSLHYGNRGRLGTTPNFNPDNNRNGLWLEASTDGSESGGIFLNGNTMVLWSPGDNDLLRLYDEDSFSSSPKFVIDSGGNVGIKTPDPQADLHLNAGGTASSDTFLIGNNSSKGLLFKDTGGAVDIQSFGVSLFINNGGENTLLNPQSGGNVGIGTTSPRHKLEVNGNAAKPGGGSWTNSSDIRLKKSIEPLSGTLGKLLKLRGVSFEWKEPEKHGNLTGQQIGMVAQEVENVFPEWVGIDPEGYKNLTFRGFEALTVEAFRELQAENEMLKLKYRELEARIKFLEETLKPMALNFSPSLNAT